MAGITLRQRQLVMVVVVVLAFTTPDVTATFSLTNCTSNQQSRLLTFTDTSVSPHPLRLPGDFSVTSSLYVRRAAVSDIGLDVTIQRRIPFFGWVTIPCIGGVGSCYYSDVCAMLNNAYGDRCPPQFLASGVPCTCPVPAGTYTMTSAVFTVAELKGVWAWLAQGDYRGTARLIDTSTREEIACQSMQLTIENSRRSCNNLFCRIFW